MIDLGTEVCFFLWSHLSTNDDDGESFDVYPADKCIGENCFPSETPSMSEKFSFNAFVVQKQSVVIARSSGLSGGEIAYRLREEEAAEENENAAYKSEFLQF